MTWLVTSDLHLTDRPRDAHRFGLFQWMAKQQRKHGVTATFILGDITDKKDNHSSALVNRIVDGLTMLAPPIYILKGNHDFVDPKNPYFRFLRCIEGLKFYTNPVHINDLNVTMIPHQPNQAEFDKACKVIPPETAGVMLHATLEGAIAESGRRLSGLQWPLMREKSPGRVVLAGDIHRPQRLANGVVYVGAPYTVRFGDDFEPRVLLVRGGKLQNLHYDCPRKWVLNIRDSEELKSCKARARDQVKVRLELAREEVVEWQTQKQQVLNTCKELGLEVFGVELIVNTNSPSKRIAAEPGHTKTPAEVMASFCKAENVASNIKRAGLELLG